MTNVTTTRASRAQTITLPSPSPIEAAKTVLGRHPKDAILYAEIGHETLDWLEAVFHAIEVLHEKGGGEIHIKRLAGLGRYVSSDMSNHIGAEHEKMAEAIEAAEAQEGGAA